MSQYYDEEGNLIPVTILRASPVVVTQVKTKEKDGYWAVQIVSGQKRRANKPLMGHLKKSGVKTPPQVIREVGVEKEEVNKLKPGERIRAEEVFSPGELVDVEGISKGRGFAGVIKRWGFSSQPKTHGQSDRERAPGSIGAQTPGRVLKGKKMPGHYGVQRVTVKNLQVLLIDSKKNEILIKGSVPGATKSWLVIRKTGKKSKKFIPLRGLTDGSEPEKKRKEN